MDDRAISTVVGFILVVLIAITFVGLVQSIMLPQWNKVEEIEHSQKLAYEIAKIGEAISLSSTTGKPTIVSLNPSLTYPNRPFLVSPTLASATISAEKLNLSIKSNKINITGKTYAIVISPNYQYSPRPKFIYEHSASFKNYDNTSIVNSKQSSFTTSSVDIYIINTTFESFATTQPVNLIFEPISYGGKTFVDSAWINFTVTNETTAWWNKTLREMYGDNVSINGNWINVSLSNIYLSVNYLLVQASSTTSKIATSTEREVVKLLNLSNPPDEVYRGVTIPLGIKAVDRFYNPVPNADVSILVNSNLVATKKTDDYGEVWYYFNTSNSGYFTIDFSIPSGDTVHYNITVIPQPSSSGIFDVYWLQGDSYYWNATLEGVLKDFGVKVEYNGNTVSGARVDFSTDNPAVLSVLNTENVTDVYGETSVTVGCIDNGTANLFATSGGSGDVIALTIENCGAVCPLVGWKYRVPITITELSGNTLTNFQVRVDLNSSFNWSAVNPDASDIRFTDSDGFTQLDYWIENWDYTNKVATIWVRIPQLPANSQVTIYMYYGNPTATGVGWHSTSSGGWYAGNGGAVFDFFDDFEGTALNTSKWVINTANYLVSNGVLRINAGAVRTNDLFNLNSNYILEGRIKYLNYWWAYSGTLTAVGPGYCSGYTCSSNLGADATVLYMRTYASGSVYTWIGSGATIGYDVSISYIFYSLNNVWYILGEKLYPNGVTLTKDRTDMRSYTFTWSKNPTKITLGAFHGVSTYDIQDTAYDWILVRKLANPEPITVVGGEERC